MPHSLDIKRLGEVFESIDDSLHRLNDWEKNFVESLQEQFEERGTLSDRQLEILERIYGKV